MVSRLLDLMKATLFSAVLVLAGCQSGAVSSQAPGLQAPGLDAARRFEEARLRGDYAAAWGLLAPGARPTGGEAAWAEVDARMVLMLGSQFAVDQVTEADLNPAWRDLEAEVRAAADWNRAVFIRVRFPESESASLGEQEFIAAPLRESGEWKLWSVR